MRVIIILFSFILSLYAQKVLVINSNSTIQKYKSVEDSFAKSFNGEFKTIDLSKMDKGEIKEYLYNEYPDIVYAIGAKAYQYANRYIPEKKIYFSSIVNYKRLMGNKKISGVSNEVYSGMHLTLINSLFPSNKKLSIVYSDYTKELFESFKDNAKIMDIEIIGQKISKGEKIDMDMLIKSDGYIMIPDPILLKDFEQLKSVFVNMRNSKKPIFAYHEVFVEHGASLVVSVDEPTVGRQIASLIKKDPKDPTVQPPMGTKVLFNKKVVEKLGIKYNRSALFVVNRIIE